MGSCCKDQDKTLKKWKKMTPRSSTSQLKLTVEPCPVILGIIEALEIHLRTTNIEQKSIS